MELTTEQLEVVNQIENWFHSESKYFSLQGPAGSGKTTILKYIIERLKCRVIATSTTNASVNVLKDALDSFNIPCATTHRYLRLKVVRTVEGTSIETDEEKEPVTSYDLAIVDECSMVGRSLWEKIEAHPAKTKWLFVGDPCQLSPVGASLSPTFKVPDNAYLKTIHRQAQDGPIHLLVNKVRNSILDRKHEIFQPVTDIDDCGSVITFKSKKKWFSSVSSWFENPDDTRCRVLTYTNKAEQAINNIIRRIVMPAEASQVEFLPDEIIYTKEPIMDGEKVVLNTSTRLRVIRCDEFDFNPTSISKFLPDDEFKYNKLVCKGEYGERIDINVLCLESMSSYQSYFNSLRYSGAVNMLKDHFTDVSHRYATTIRRAQGWNLKYVAFSLPELTKCRSETDRAHNYYSALSRASELALILV